MRQEVASLIHHVDGLFAIGNSHMHVQAEDKIGARDLLHVSDNGGVALAHRD